MNMKKTIAAVAACAVATSAMATTVFADDSVSLKYNLVRNVYSVEPGSVTFSTQIEHLSDTTAKDFVQIQLKDISGNLKEEDAKWTVSGNTLTDNVRDKAFNFVDFIDGTHSWELNASSWVKSPYNGTSVMTIPVDDKGINPTTGGFTATVAVTTPHLGSDWNGADLAAEMSYTVGAGLADLVVTDAKVLALNPVWAADHDPAPTVEGKIVVKELAPAYDVADGAFIKYDINDNKVLDAKEDKTVSELYAVPNVIAALEAGTDDAKEAINFADDEAVKVILHTVMSAWSATSEKVTKYPMLTNYNTTSRGANYKTITSTENDTGNLYVTAAYPENIDGALTNILEYLSADDMSLISKGKSYINVVPVINDVIANYDDVTFTFNTAADGVNAKGEYDANGDKQYTKFAQHLYNLYGDENTEYVYSSSYDWTGYNLWAGALVVNGNLTMSLQDTNVFDYGATTLSFNWTDAIDGAVVNTYATYLTKMQLATSYIWFWDSLEVTGANTEAEDVASDAGVEADEDVIEEDVEEDVVEEDIEEDVVEEDVEEDVVVDEPVVEDVPVVENPGTGNAPVALAVIPVALAAAAVVAKKRG
ncbi:MAG: hypothetical protein IJF18_00605 [Oscillospiraceae bacterium]|nr:hypothetical protein [Oscillospiraceae bacterium]